MPRPGKIISLPRLSLSRRDLVTPPKCKTTHFLLSLINNHFQGKITLEEVARHCGMGVFQFSRAFKRERGLTFREFLVRYRIDQARKSPKNPRITVLDSAFIAGFNDPSYFARLFKRYVGVSPSQYRLDLLEGRAPYDGSNESSLRLQSA